MRQARLRGVGGWMAGFTLLLVHPSFTFVLCCTWGARAALASTISLRGYALHAVRRVVQHPAFWFLARSKRGLSRLTNRAFRAGRGGRGEGGGGGGILTSWYSLNCIQVRTSIWCGDSRVARGASRFITKSYSATTETAVHNRDDDDDLDSVIVNPVVIIIRFGFTSLFLNLKPTLFIRQNILTSWHYQIIKYRKVKEFIRHFYFNENKWKKVFLLNNSENADFMRYKKTFRIYENLKVNILRF